MIKLKDRTTYSQRNTDRTPRIIDLILSEAGIKYTVHRHIDYPGTWLLSCNGYFDKEDLHTDDFYKATTRATKRMLDEFKANIAKLSVAVDEIERAITEKKEGEQ